MKIGSHQNTSVKVLNEVFGQGPVKYYLTIHISLYLCSHFQGYVLDYYHNIWYILPLMFDWSELEHLIFLWRLNKVAVERGYQCYSSILR